MCTCRANASDFTLSKKGYAVKYNMQSALSLSNKHSAISFLSKWRPMHRYFLGGPLCFLTALTAHCATGW